MVYHFTFDWPQVIITFSVFVSFVCGCFKSARQANMTDSIVMLVIDFLWLVGTLYLLSAGGFYG